MSGRRQTHPWHRGKPRREDLREVDRLDVGPSALRLSELIAKHRHAERALRDDCSRSSAHDLARARH